MADGEHLNAIAREALELPSAARINHIRHPRWIGYTRAKQLLDKLDDLLTHTTWQVTSSCPDMMQSDQAGMHTSKMCSQECP